MKSLSGPVVASSTRSSCFTFDLSQGMRMNASCRRVLRLASPLTFARSALDRPLVSEAVQRSTRSVWARHKLFRLRSARIHSCRLQLEVHGATKGRRDVHERVDGEARHPPTQQVVDARLSDPAAGCGFDLGPALSLIHI